MVSFSAAQEAARLLLEGSQRYTCLVGGARSGKTFLIVRAIVDRALLAPGSRHAMLRLRANAAWASLAQETLPKVLALCFPEVGVKEHRGDGTFTFPNEARLMIGGLDDKDRVEKILGLEFVSLYLNEASQIPYSSALVAFTRLAQRVPELTQHAYVDLNPTIRSHWTNVLFGDKQDPVTNRPLADPGAYQRLFLNPRDNKENLTPEFLQSLASLPEGKRLRFYEGVYVDSLDEALWTPDLIDSLRRDETAIPVEGRRGVVVAVDPSGASSEDDLKRDEIGIVVAARGEDGHAYVLADRSCRAGPPGWSERVVTAFHEFSADCVVAEENYGGAMVASVIQTADRNVPVHLVTASRGKTVRAEPIALRYALGQVHHVGRFEKLERQLCAFSTAGYLGGDSPDHADAAIWALTHLFRFVPGMGIHDFYRDLAER